MQAVTVETVSADGPTLFHTSASGLLLWAQNTPATYRHQPGDRAAVSGDDILGSRLDFPHATRKSLVCFAKGDRSSHP
jgi:hypothetical protein